jgi:hypothetical protein
MPSVGKHAFDESWPLSKSERPAAVAPPLW